MQYISRNDFLQNMQQGIQSITANNRLKRTLKLESSRYQNDNFVSPNIDTLSEWVIKILDTAVFNGQISLETLPDKILTDLEQEIIFTKIIKETEQDINALLSFSEIAKQAKEAYHLLQMYNIDINNNGNNYFASTELKRFKIWHKKYQIFCKQKKCLDETELLILLNNVIDAIVINEPIQIVGFEDISPLLNSLFSKLNVSSLQDSINCEQSFQAAFDSFEDEIKSAALWAQQIIAKNKTAKIGIIVPQLESHHNLIKNTFKSILYPEQINLDLSNYQPIHNLSLGLPLYDYALVETAINWLEILYSPDLLDYQSISSLLNSPHWTVEFGDINSRIEFDWIFRKNTKPQLTVKQFLNNLYDFDTKFIWIDRLKETIEQSLKEQKLTNFTHQWSLRFDQILNSLGIANFQQSSISEQLLLGVKSAFTQLEAMTNLQGKITAFEAIKLLKQITQKQTFQFRSTDNAPIQIMGILESNSQIFDFVWFFSANSQLLPASTRLNSILPKELQQQYQMPKSSASQELIYAKNIITRLQHSTKILIFSYAKTDINGIAMMSSGLIKHLPLFTDLPKLPIFKAKKIKTEVFEDTRGLPFDTTRPLKNALQFFKAQAICPLMAYAEYRLNAQFLPEPLEDFHCLTRGNLIHKILENLLSNSQQNSTQIIKQIIENHAKTHQVQPQLTKLEIKRISKIIQRWQDEIETQRPSFKTIGLEVPLSTNLQGLFFSMRIDRIDAINNLLILIDYKTSNQINRQGLFDERLTEPQLPIYATLLEKEVGSIAFVQLLARNISTYTLGEITVLNNNKDILTHTKWLDLKETWRKKLIILAEEIKTGQSYFINNDKVNNIISRSPALGFCRVYDDIQ